MPMMTRTILTAAPLGDALGLALVELTPRSARTLASEAMESAESSSPDLVSAAATRVVSGRSVSEIIVVAPAEWCATREIGIAPVDWGGAREGVMESLEDLVPVAAEDAIVGLLGLCDTEENCTRGVLVASRREPVDALLAALRPAASGAHESVISSSMAALGLGLGLGEEADAVVIEPGGVAETTLSLRYGLPVAIDAAPAPGVRTVRLGTDVSCAQLAAASASCRRAAPSVIAPLSGRQPRVWTRHAYPAAIAAAAVAMIAATPFIWGARLDAGAERARAERVALKSEFDAAQDTRREAERYAELCAAFDEAVAGWESVVPTVRDAVGALEDDGHLYRFQLDSRGVLLTGEAADPGSVLERLESAASLSGARPTTPMTPSPTDPSMRVFTFSAQEETP